MARNSYLPDVSHLARVSAFILLPEDCRCWVVLALTPGRRKSTSRTPLVLGADTPPSYTSCSLLPLGTVGLRVSLSWYGCQQLPYFLSLSVSSEIGGRFSLPCLPVSRLNRALPCLITRTITYCGHVLGSG